MVDAIYLAAGRGVRAGLGYPKQLARLGGRPILIHGLELLEALPAIARVIVACIPDQVDQFGQVIADYGIRKAFCVPGGTTRQESVRLALAHVETTRVLVHEAVRPFVTPEHVQELLAVDAGAVVPVVPLVPTVLDTQGHYLSRPRLRAVQLPQVYDTAILRRAHAGAAGREFPDDSSLVRAVTGVWPALVEGLEANIKLTSPLDLAIAEAIYHALGGGDGGQ